MPTVVGSVRSRTFRVLWALEELEIPYTHVPAAPRSDEALKLVPSGKVPVYVEDDGTVITESVAIMTYLADRHGCLTHPAGSPQRAQQDSLTHMILDELDSTLWTASKHSFVLPEERRVKAVKETLRWEFAQGLDRLAQRLGHPFVMGEVMTIPDILLAHCFGWAIVAKFPVEQPVVRDHFERMRARPAYRRARKE